MFLLSIYFIYVYIMIKKQFYCRICEKQHDCIKSYAKYGYIGFVCESCWNTFITRIKTIYKP
jgi:hypothetical protein